MRILSWIILIGLLSACTHAALDITENDFETTAITGIAWGEQIQVNSNIISATKPVSLQYKIGTGPLQTLSPIYKNNGVVVFSLPESPSLPALPSFTAPYKISQSQYDVVPSQTQQNKYKNRGIVTVTISSAGKSINRNYQPFGSVEAGQLTVMVESSNCATFQTQLSSLAYSLIDTVSTGDLCYATVGFTTKGTQQALNQLQATLNYPNIWIDKNTIETLDPPAGSRGFDPSCDQIINWLDPSASGYTLLSPNNLLSATNATSAQAAGVRGAGINIFLIGGGIDANDQFECLDAQGNLIFEDHDTHVAEIISTLAPDAYIEERIVCDAAGNCLTSEIVKALLDIKSVAQTNVGKDLINMSLGGPLPSTVLEHALELIESGITVITSNGNSPFSASHFPASYSSGGTTPGPLDNVIAVSAVGFANNAWRIAGFNTRGADLFAPGVDVCVTTATTIRCDPLAPAAPENLGLTGSSFAAPVMTAMAALYLDSSSQNLQPADIRGCLTASALLNPNLSRMAWFDSTVCP